MFTAQSTHGSLNHSSIWREEYHKSEEAKFGLENVTDLASDLSVSFSDRGIIFSSVREDNQAHFSGLHECCRPFKNVGSPSVS